MGIIKIQNKNGKISYKARVYLGLDAGGKEIRKTQTFDKKKAASDWLNDMHKRKGVGVNIKIQIFHQVLVNYFESLVLNKKANTIKSYRQNFNNWALPYFKFARLDKITSSMVEDYVQELYNNGATAETVKYTLNRLKHFLDWAVRKKYIRENPASEIDPPMLGPKEIKIKYHSYDEVMTILDYMRGSDYHQFITFLYSTGLRISEACAVRIENIDLKNGVIHVVNNLSPYEAQAHEPIMAGALYLDSTKNQEIRSLPLSDELLGMIREISQGRKKGEFLFQTKRGLPRAIVLQRGKRPIIIESKIINPREFAKSIFKPFQQRAGISNILGVHGTRHTFASHYMMNGGDLFTLQKLLGHKSINSTMVYAHLSPEHLEKSRNLVSFETKPDLNRTLIPMKRIIK